MKIKMLFSLLFCFFINLSVFADEIKMENNTEVSFFTGMFDFSDDGKKSSLIGFHTSK